MEKTRWSNGARDGARWTRVPQWYRVQQWMERIVQFSSVNPRDWDV